VNVARALHVAKSLRLISPNSRNRATFFVRTTQAPAAAFMRHALPSVARSIAFGGASMNCRISHVQTNLE
jgi:hypothetical protein